MCLLLYVICYCYCNMYIVKEKKRNSFLSRIESAVAGRTAWIDDVRCPNTFINCKIDTFGL